VATKYPASHIYKIYYVEKEKRYQMFEDRTRIELTEDEFLEALRENREQNQASMHFFESQIQSIKRGWGRAAAEIDVEKLQFFYDFGFLSEEEYLHYYGLHSQLNQRKNEQ
jgi:hypothetical protein